MRLAGRQPPLLVDLGENGRADPDRAGEDLNRVGDEALDRALDVDDLEVGPVAADHSIVGDLTTGFGVEGGAVEDDLAALAGLVAVCAGSDLMHPLGALVVGGVAGAIFVSMFTLTQNKWKIDDVLGVWPLHGLCGTWGGLAAGLFGSTALGGLGGVSLTAQLLGTLLGVGWAVLCGFLVYGALKAGVGLRLSQEEEYDGADLSIHRIGATPEREVNW